MRIKDFDRALEDFDKAIEINSKFASAYHNRGMALSGKGRDDKAAEEFSKVIEMNPNSPVLYKDRGTAYSKLGEYQLAKKDFEKSIEFDKKFAPGYSALGLLLATANDSSVKNPALAKRFAEKAVSMGDSTAPELTRNLAEVHKALHEDAAAIITLKKAISMDPSNKEFAKLLQEWEKAAPTRVSTQPEPTQSKAFYNLW
jgi:tetratricopeptide (TPR) repeat protein